MIKQNITPQDVVDYLNDLFELDPEAIYKLLDTRVPCNEALADHESVQVRSNPDGSYSVGLLGILNGLLGTIEEGKYQGWGILMFNGKDDGDSHFGFTTDILKG